MSSVGKYYCRGQRDYGKDAVASYISIVDLGGSVYSVCLVGAVETAAIDCQFAWLVQLRQLHPLPFAFAVRSDSVRHPIGFCPPSNRIPFAVQSVSVRCLIGLRSVYDDISGESMHLFFTYF